MRVRHLTPFAVALIAAAPFVTAAAPAPTARPGAGVSVGAPVAAGRAQQGPTDRSHILAPTWKTFSTAAGRGTSIAVSTGGNLTSYLSPNQAGARYEHIGVGDVGEGYVLCYSGLAGSAFDLGSNASGFAAPTVTANAITRRTTDNRVELTQTFKFTAPSAGSIANLLITMKLRNVSGAPLTGVVLRRQVDFDIDTGGPQGWAGFLSNHSRTRATVSAFHDPVEAPASLESHGITLGSVTTPGAFTTLVTASILDSSCSPAEAPQSPDFFVSRGDFGDTVRFDVGTIKVGATKVAEVRYFRF